MEDFKPYDEYIDMLSQALLFGLFSEREAFGQSVNEANSIGVLVVIAKPWGLHFEVRTRTLVVDLKWSIEEIADGVYQILSNAYLEKPSYVPTWGEATRKYLDKLI